ncbi:hypothetical protein JNJ66_01865 [Candidatus Saccharibacteria bacterium]|nr:hypothetical protein [Candidatus Saccharibacteria bacterium]
MGPRSGERPFTPPEAKAPLDTPAVDAIQLARDVLALVAPGYMQRQRRHQQNLKKREKVSIWSSWPS